jgi:hypothetical protein
MHAGISGSKGVFGMVELEGLGSLSLGRSKGLEGIHAEPLNFIKSSTLKVGLMPQSAGRSNTYAFDPTLLSTSNGPALRACSFWEVPDGNLSGLSLTIT